MKQHTHWLLLFLGFMTACVSTNDRILFSSSRAGNADIYMMDKNGESLLQITNSPYEEWSPVWLENYLLSYLRQEGDSINIIIHDLVGSQESISPHPVNCKIDDKNIRYSRRRQQEAYTCEGDVYWRKSRATTPVNLTREVLGHCSYVEWAGEGTLIFTNNQTGNNDVYIFDIKSRELINLTNNLANDERGSRSPNGHLLVYSSDRFETGNQEIVLQDLRTGTFTNISQNPGADLIARWSRDGQRIYYGSNKDGNWEIYSYNLKTQRTKRLTDNSAFDGDPQVN